MKAWVFLLFAFTGVLSAEVEEESVVHGGIRFRVVRLRPEQLHIVWKDDAGQPYRTFAGVQAALAKEGKKAAFLMNAGIFEPGGIPSGLHIEGGRQLKALNLANGRGNFFLKPNGVFAITTSAGKGKARALIADAVSFAKDKKASPPVTLAVQSGPLLLAAGMRHPAVKEGSENKLHRNGVGIDTDGSVVFAMTDKRQFVNLWDFAGLFLKLGCKNALFLDGDLSQMAGYPAAPVESNRFGAIFVVAE